MDKSYNIWDNYPEEDNLMDGTLALENMGIAPFDDDDRIDMPPPPIAMFNPTKTPTIGALGTTSSS
jgi:hypothetical protein